VKRCAQKPNRREHVIAIANVPFYFALLDDKGRCRSRPILRRDALLFPDSSSGKLGFGRVTRHTENGVRRRPPYESPTISPELGIGTAKGRTFSVKLTRGGQLSGDG
jgi:hypothetical protein